MAVFQFSQPLAGPPCRFAIGPAIPQPADEGAHFFLPIADRAFQPLASLFLPSLGLLLLLFPTLQQLIVEQLCARQ